MTKTRACAHRVEHRLSPTGIPAGAEAVAAPKRERSGKLVLKVRFLDARFVGARSFCERAGLWPSVVDFRLGELTSMNPHAA